MSAHGTLALVLAPDASSPEGVELLRIVAALVAADQPVHLVCAGAGRAALDDDALSAEAATYVDGVADFGVVRELLDGDALLDAIEGARDLVRLAPSHRTGTPALLVIDDAWLAAAREDPAGAITSLASAGQVVRA